MSFVLAVAMLAELESVKVDRDDVRIDKSCTLEIAAHPIEDANGDGVIQIVGDDLTIDFGKTRLSGAKVGAQPDSFAGVGVRITGKRVKIVNAMVSGFHAAIWATKADGLVLENCDVSGNWCQRLRSTEKAEDGADWLFPHENDQNQWLVNYGAGIYVEESSHIIVRDCRAEHGQNGLLMRKVVDSLVVDNDFSFLSGWGIGMFRCERDRVLNNSCDFCVRGYSHGVYSRGQDSAGILFFEQNKDNVIAFNSATHSGDGFFGFAGKEALEGDVKAPKIANVRNVIAKNDLSYEPAIGIEMTFSFDNVFASNKLDGSNYGIWGGYSSETEVIDNEIEENEISGIAIEHGSRWTIVKNRFAHNPKGIELWWNDNKDLLSKPWAKFNRTDSAEHYIAHNRFDGDAIGIELRGGTFEVEDEANEFQKVAQPFLVDAKSSHKKPDGAPRNPAAPPDDASLLGDVKLGARKAVGARDELAGRDKIIVTEWGPYDWKSPYLQRLAPRDGAHVFRLLGREAIASSSIDGDAKLETEGRGDDARLLVRAKTPGSVASYTLRVKTSSGELQRSGVLVASRWRVRVFPWTHDPRKELELWHDEAKKALEFARDDLNLPYANGGPSQLADVPQSIRDAKLPTDRFGTLADTKLTIPAGKWRIATTSDDGLRVWLDEKLVIDHWDWHPPAPDHYEFSLDRKGEHALRVEHFEIDGYSILSLDLERAE